MDRSRESGRPAGAATAGLPDGLGPNAPDAERGPTGARVARGIPAASLVLLALAFGPAPRAAAGPVPEALAGWGKLGEAPIWMSLDFEDGDARGYYWYEKAGEILPLKGAVGEDGGITLTGSDGEGKATGTFRGKLASPQTIEGTWSKADGSGTAAFVVEDARLPTPKLPRPSPWFGEWEPPEIPHNYTAYLQIFAVEKESFRFQLAAARGGHSGEIEGTARIEGTRADCRIVENCDHCRVRFALDGGGIRLDATDECDDCAGVGVELRSGVYRLGIQERKLPTLVKLGALPDEETEKAFMALVGDYYQDFVHDFQEVSDEDDLDGFGAKVRQGWVLGLATLQEAIVMFAPQGKIWAALIDTSDDTVAYFTNVPGSEETLPKTIERWRERFEEKQIYYMDARDKVPGR